MPGEIASQIAKPANTVRSQLHRLDLSGHVRKLDDGRWELAVEQESAT